MALKDIWQDLQDAVAGDPNSGSDLTVKPINDIAKAVIDLEDEKVEITVDSELNENSKNPVQNKVVAIEIEKINTNKTDKTTIIKEEADVDVASIIMEDNHIYHTQMVYGKLTVELPEELEIGYTSVLYFITPFVIPDDYTSFPENIKFKGDSVEDERFIPEVNMRYTIVFDYDGISVIGYVSGVSL